MKPILAMSYDDNRRMVGDMAQKAARRYAEFHGMEFRLISPLAEESPWWYKVSAAYSCYDAPWVAVIDADVLMRKPCAENAIPVPKHIGMSVNWAGLCTGFLVSANTSTALKLLTTWRSVGESVHERFDHSPHDEASLKILAANFKWINKAIARIPASLVSSPEHREVGAVAHHFVASNKNQLQVALDMTAMFVCRT